MTTEVAIMNRGAVALAADSAVTLETETGVKIYDSVNKLFELIKGRPVGVMVYQSSDVAWRPWETVIKVYREDRGSRAFGGLDEYKGDLLDYVQSHRHLFSEDQQIQAFIISSRQRALALRGRINARVQSSVRTSGSTTVGQIQRIVGGEVTREKVRIDAWSPGPWASDMPSETALMREYSTVLDWVVDSVFQSLPVSPRVRSRIRTTLLRSFVRYDPSDPEFSGVVIAGFGQDEYYPSLREVRVKGIFKNVLMTVEGATENIGAHQWAYVDSFAQGDMVRSFTAGIQDKVRAQIQSYWTGWARRARVEGRRAALTAVPRLASRNATAVGVEVQKIADGAVGDFLDYMQRYEGNIQADLLGSLAVLPKDEMGAMAESLVNLTTLKRRVSLTDAQTVGGAVDVAAISRGDGFVWLKRKHYFDAALNPTWATAHAGVKIGS